MRWRDSLRRTGRFGRHKDGHGEDPRNLVRENLVKIEANSVQDKPAEPVAKLRGTSVTPVQRFGLFVLLLSAAFCRSLGALIASAVSSDLDSYVLLIPFVVAYLVYLKRDQLPGFCRTSPGLAAVSMAAGILTLGVAWFQSRNGSSISNHDLLTLQILAFVSCVIGGGFLFLGRDWMKQVAFPAALLVFMVPLPDGMVAWLETGSKLASADVAYLFFLATGTPVLRDGLVFRLPRIAIEVAQQCSGIRSSLVLFITALLLSHLFLSTTWRRCLFVALVIPLGFVRNGFRILTLGLLASHVDPALLDSAIHKHGGSVFFVLSLVPLAALLWWLRRGEKSAVLR